MKLKLAKPLLETKSCCYPDCKEKATTKLYNKPYCSEHYFFVRTKNRAIAKFNREIKKSNEK